MDTTANKLCSETTRSAHGSTCVLNILWRQFHCQ